MIAFIVAEVFELLRGLVDEHGDRDVGRHPAHRLGEDPRQIRALSPGWRVGAR